VGALAALLCLGADRIKKDADSDTHHIRASNEGLRRNWSDRGVSSLHPSSAPPEMPGPKPASLGEKAKPLGVPRRLCCLSKRGWRILIWIKDAACDLLLRL